MICSILSCIDSDILTLATRRTTRPRADRAHISLTTRPLLELHATVEARLEGEEHEKAGARRENMGARQRSINPPLFYFACWLLLVIVGLACRSDAFSLLSTGGPRRPGGICVLGRKFFLHSWLGLLLFSAELLVEGVAVGVITCSVLSCPCEEQNI